MRRLVQLGAFIVAVSSLSLMVIDCTNAAPGDERTEASRVAWNEFLSKKCQTGQTEQTIRELMNGRCRDIGIARANSEVYRLLFLIDDFHQIEFAFDRGSKLLITPTVEPKGQWIRMPSGDVYSVPSADDIRTTSKIKHIAIDYVEKHTDYNRDSLLVYCRRSAKPGTWDVVIVIDNVEVDAPSYLFEVTDDGGIVEIRQ